MSNAESTTLTRYDCTSGGAQFCQGCYQMTADEDGEYVKYEEISTLAYYVADLIALIRHHMPMSIELAAVQQAEAAVNRVRPTPAALIGANKK